jgi:T-complex protein 1 subunit delta
MSTAQAKQLSTHKATIIFRYILGLCKKIKKAGCNVLLVQKSILRDAVNDLSLHFLAKMGILVIKDVERTDVEFICRTVGCRLVQHRAVTGCEP